jgi:hypothetical protein
MRYDIEEILKEELKPDSDSEDEKGKEEVKKAEEPK